MLEEKRDRNGGRKKGREHGLQTPIQSQQTNGRPTREKRGEGRDERNIKGWDTNARHKRTWQLVESHGPNELAVSWASSNWGKARELPCVFSDRSSRSGTVHTWIKGETQSRLSESADWTRSTSWDKRVIDGWPRSKQARGQLSTDHHRHNNATPPPTTFVYTVYLIWSLRFTALEGWDAEWKAESTERGHICIPTCLESAHIPSQRQWESLFTARCQTVDTRNSCLLARALFCALFLFRHRFRCPMETFHSKYPRNCIHMVWRRRLCDEKTLKTKDFWKHLDPV